VTESGTFDGVFTSPTAPKSCTAFVAGTGRLEGIKGSKSWSSRACTPAPENLQYLTIFDMEYTLPNT